MAGRAKCCEGSESSFAVARQAGGGGLSTPTSGPVQAPQATKGGGRLGDSGERQTQQRARGHTMGYERQMFCAQSIFRGARLPRQRQRHASPKSTGGGLRRAAVVPGLPCTALPARRPLRPLLAGDSRGPAQERCATRTLRGGGTYLSVRASCDDVDAVVTPQHRVCSAAPFHARRLLRISTCGRRATRVACTAQLHQARLSCAAITISNLLVSRNPSCAQIKRYRRPNLAVAQVRREP